MAGPARIPKPEGVAFDLDKYKSIRLEATKPEVKQVVGNSRQQEELLARMAGSQMAFNAIVLRREFNPNYISAYHYDVAREISLRGEYIKPLLQCMPRGHGKTIFTCGMILRDFLMKDMIQWGYKTPDFLFYCWLAEAERQSLKNLNYIKSQIESNQILHHFFGSADVLKTTKWSADRIELSNGCALQTFSSTSGFRGSTYDGRRPDMAICDDVESENNTKTQNARDGISDFFTGVVVPAVNPITGIVQINGTPVHHDCFLMRTIRAIQNADRLGKSSPWRLLFRRTSINEPLWPEYQGTDVLQARKDQLEFTGFSHVWYREYEMSIEDESTKKLSEADLRSYDGALVASADGCMLHITSIDGEATDQLVPVRLYGGVDSASSVNTGRNDFTAFVITAIDHLGREFEVLSWQKRGMPHQTVPSRPDSTGIANTICDISDMIPVDEWIIEDTVGSKGVFDGIDTIAYERKRTNKSYVSPYVIRYVPTGKGEKNDRIYNTFSKKAALRQLFVRESSGDLRRQWREFGPLMGHDDLIDAHHMSSMYASPPPPPRRPVPIKDYGLNEAELRAHPNWGLPTQPKNNWKTQ